ncbi:unnamed protein product [[Candida] boidinii]|nr:unnamed protein product [[Candida] boidinii]
MNLISKKKLNLQNLNSVELTNEVNDTNDTILDNSNNNHDNSNNTTDIDNHNEENSVKVRKTQESFEIEDTFQEDDDDNNDIDIHDFPEGGLKAWLVVFGAFCSLLVALMCMNSTGAFQAYISTHQLSNVQDYYC